MNNHQPQRQTWRRLSKIILPLLLSLFLLPIFVQIWAVKTTWLQLDLAKLAMKTRTADLATYIDWARTSYSSGYNQILRIIRNLGKTPPLPDYADKPAMLRYIVAQLPSYGVAYPTEGFYYFRTPWNGRELRGNFRLADLDKGLLSFVYYLHAEKQGVPSETQIFRVGAAEGMHVKKINDYLYDVNFDGKLVRFKLSDVGDHPPRKIKLLPGEEFVAQDYDESGVRFFLLRNPALKSYYYVLNDEIGLTETLTPRAELKDLLFGQRTGFVFYDDKTYNRRVLVGINLDEGLRNTYFDGPGDQVPFRLELGSDFRLYYPAAYLSAGIDNHGVFLGKDVWSRHVIAPFISYANFNQLDERLMQCIKKPAGPEHWSCITKEWWKTEDFLVMTYKNLQAEGKDLKVFIPNDQERQEMLKKIAAYTKFAESTKHAKVSSHQ